MGTKKQYGNADNYEQKLSRVMDRLGIKNFSYNFDRFGCWVEFRYRNDLYRFEHSLEKAKAKGINLRYGSDAFAQVVLALEDLARMVERGIYELGTWVAGMKFLPPPIEMPNFIKFLGFEKMPSSKEDIKERFRQLAKTLHPDAGGTEEDFMRLKDASEQAMKWFEERKHE
ncbi:J domain-containing protein [Desulfosporosinus sp. PR]|uniref:J domain-containing protein n=1 Tax=Candidatus Desulfosporosinus nitrosoreducens TaxID=3401928 RepID=UPI0027FC95CA|nr:J domain-containing protein [Desulfosporosinus sp. PR]MDQ7095971.1 J domain-containing protein [Desulfosporosinus sp. PR]